MVQFWVNVLTEHRNFTNEIVGIFTSVLYALMIKKRDLGLTGLNIL